jgi:uncharacterized protein (UPF0332 family)
MNSAEQTYLRHRLKRAAEALEAADILLRAGHATSAVNRLYYACFYAVTALLFSEGRSAARHSGVLVLFDQHWVRTGRVPREMGKFFHIMFERRQEGDYRDTVTFSSAEVAVWLQETREFVARLSHLATP